MKKNSLVNKLLQSIQAYFAGGWAHFIKTALKGIFWLAPIAAIFAIIYWLYGKADFVAEQLFHLVGLTPKQYPILWTLFGVFILVMVSYMIGHFIDTRIGNWVKNIFEFVLSKIPGYLLVKKLINLFNSSKEGDKNILVVMIKDNYKNSYRIGLMYSIEESCIKGHYSVTISMSPLPNGGFIYEKPADKIWVLEGVTFNHYLEYLLSMGSTSIAKIAGIEPKNPEDFPSLKSWLKKGSNKKRSF